MGFTMHDGEVREAGNTATVDKTRAGGSRPAPGHSSAGHWESVQVRWPGDLSQRMYKRPGEHVPWARKNAGLLASVAILAAAFLTTLGGESYATADSARTPVISRPTVSTTAQMAELPEFNDAYLDRHSIRPQADIGMRRARNKFRDTHGGN